MEKTYILKDQELFQQIAEGNEIAFREVFDKYKSPIYHFISKFIYSESEAEENVQDTFLVIWKNRKQLGNIQHPRNYIYTIARNNAYQYLLKVSRNEKAIKTIWQNMDAGRNTVQELIDARECEQTIYQSISHLSPIKQQIFAMSRKEGMTHEEIAQETGLSKSRVKNVIVEMLKIIKSELTLGTIISIYLLKIENIFL